MRTRKFSIGALVLVMCVLQCNATIDLSNVDLLNFNYFKNVPHQGFGKEALLAPITEKLQKVKAVLLYFKNVLLGNPEHEEVRIIEFDPHFGEAWHPHYEHHYGPRGVHLIEALGRGHPPHHLAHHEAIHHHDHFVEHY